MISVSVRTLSGASSFERTLDRDTAVDSLKKLIAAEWNVPESCQRLLARHKALDESDLLGDQSLEQNVLPLTLVVTLNKIWKEILLAHGYKSSASLAELRTVLANLRSFGVEASSANLAAVMVHIDDADWRVREASIACVGVGMLARRGDLDALAAVLPHLVDSSRHVRTSAWHSYAHLAEDGAYGAVARDHLCHPFADVREEALALLLRSSDATDPGLIEEVGCRLEDESGVVRSLAGTGLVNLAQTCRHRDALDALVVRLAHGERYVRLAALEALCQLAPRGDRRVMEAVVAIIGDRDDDVGQIAARALGQFADKHDPDAVDALLALLERPAAPGRKAILAALGPLATGDPRAINAAAACLEDPDGAVRRAAKRTLKLLADKGDAVAIASVLPRAEHADAGVRRAAEEVLARLRRGVENG